MANQDNEEKEKISVIKKNRDSLNAKIATFELAKTPIKKERSEHIAPLRPVLRGVRDYIHTEICKNANES